MFSGNLLGTHEQLLCKLVEIPNNIKKHWSITLVILDTVEISQILWTKFFVVTTELYGQRAKPFVIKNESEFISNDTNIIREQQKRWIFVENTCIEFCKKTFCQLWKVL